MKGTGLNQPLRFIDLGAFMKDTKPKSYEIPRALVYRVDDALPVPDKTPRRAGYQLPREGFYGKGEPFGVGYDTGFRGKDRWAEELREYTNPN